MEYVLGITDLLLMNETTEQFFQALSNYVNAVLIGGDTKSTHDNLINVSTSSK